MQYVPLKSSFKTPECSRVAHVPVTETRTQNTVTVTVHIVAARVSLQMKRCRSFLPGQTHKCACVLLSLRNKMCPSQERMYTEEKKMTALLISKLPVLPGGSRRDPRSARLLASNPDVGMRGAFLERCTVIKYPKITTEENAALLIQYTLPFMWC